MASKKHILKVSPRARELSLICSLMPLLISSKIMDGMKLGGRT
uniref:Uncharacterized protein n=1 Tax=Rhizophora mucronata TaxID=61149 RepID=A0A2P2P1Y4_RHIMU